MTFTYVILDGEKTHTLLLLPIILAIAGPWVCVLGGVFVQKTITQPLIDYIWLGSDPFDSTQQVFVAQLFKSAIKILPIH